MDDSALKQIGNLTNLHKLFFWDTSITDDGMVHLARLINLQNLYMRKNSRITDVSMIGQLTNLEYLDINNPTAVKGFNQLKNLHKLKILTIESTPLDDKNMEFLADLSELTEINFEGTQITGSGLVHLKSLKNLTKLNLKNTKVNQGIEYLKSLTNLKELDLEGTKISDSEMVHLQSLKNLEKLNLTGTKISDSGMVHLQSLTNLKEIHLDGTNITSAGMKNLKNLTKPNWLTADVKMTKAELSELQESLPKCDIIIMVPLTRDESTETPESENKE